MTTDWDVIVIGAGPAGSVVARQLALGGRRVLLLDKKLFPRRKVCGACLNHAAVSLLEEIGLGDILHDSGAVELSGFHLRSGSRRLSLPLPSGRAVSRSVLDQQLVEAAIRAGVTFQDGVIATVGEANDDGRIVELKHATESIQAKPQPALPDCSPDSAAERRWSLAGDTSPRMFADDCLEAPEGRRRINGNRPSVALSGLSDSDAAETGGLRPRLNSFAASRLRTLTSAKVVLAADGLGNPSLCSVREIHDRTTRSARVGAGCEVTEFSAEYTPGVIHMAVGRGGYVGLVCVESGALNIAAAFDARLIRDSGGPARAASNVLSQAGFPAISTMAEAEWLGTPALTRSTTPVAVERLFVLGDASGYVEPFTGEGMGWALASAVALAPLANAACDDWQPALATTWSREHMRIVGRRQRACRMLAALLKSPTCVRCAMLLLPKVPNLLQPLVRGVSLSMPQSLTISLSDFGERGGVSPPV